MPTVYIEVFGCQMNIADSELVTEALARRGFEKCENRREADLVIVNTCSVREKAESRALAHIRELVAHKRKSGLPKAVWVIGCMAARKGEKLTEEIPGIDRVIGAPDIEFFENYADSYLSDFGHDEPHLQANAAGARKASVFVPIMRGCNNFCTYCIVPHVRGREHSVPSDHLLHQISQAVADGATEVTLLGQNVNSYHDGRVNFPALLRSVHQIEGLKRIRFTTSHPKDCTEDLIEALAELPKCAKHIHLPVQSGSSRVLALMNRHYTREHYLSLIHSMRKALPAIDITTDILVGFPGETQEDFEQTLSLVTGVRFTSAFMFAYSPRPGTRANDLDDNVPAETKKNRLERIIAAQTDITKEHFRSMVGRKADILIVDRKNGESGMWIGQDNGCKNALVSCSDCRSGMILNTTVLRSSGMTLLCERTAS